MKLPQISISRCYRIIVICFCFAVMGCQGLDDWSDLKNIDLLGDSSDSDAAKDTFKRYNEPGLSSQPLVEYILDEGNLLSKTYCDEIRKACDYTKVPFHSMNVSNWNISLKIAPTTRVFVVYDTKKLNDASIAKLMEFVSNGGTLFVPYANDQDKRMAFFYGFRTDAEFDTDSKSAGWKFTTPVLPNLRGKDYSKALVHYGFAAQNFSNRVKIFAAASNNPKYPAIVENTMGKGRVLLYNTTGYFIKADRGLLFAGVIKGLEGLPYPIANSSTFFLDDFPSPLYDIKAEPVASELNLSMRDFVKNVWWPDLQALSKEYKISYSAMLIFDYRNKVIPPFTLDQWNAEKFTFNNKTEPMSDWLVRDVAKSGSELAFHGYNHVSFEKKLWRNQQFIQTSMNTVKKKWRTSNFGELPTSYVPPSNIIDKDGLVALKKAMPSLKYICSLYLGETFEGGNREFDYDPYEKDFFDYPRVSDGFYMDDDHFFNAQSVYLFTGIWTHFLHPDDIFQIPSPKNTSAGDYDLRNPLGYGWYKTKGKDKAMLPEFKKMLKQMTSSYPQMRFLSAKDGAKKVIDWRASRYSNKFANGFYNIEQTNSDNDGKQYWFMYGSPANAERIEARLKGQAVLYSKTSMMDGYLYSIYTNKPKLSVVDLLYKMPKEKAEQLKINELVAAKFATYNAEVAKFLKFGNWVDDTDEKFRIELATLKDKMINTATIDSVTWNKYAKYMSWDNKGDVVWKMLDEHVAKYPSDNNLMYSKELDKVIGYTDDIEKEKWMSAQLLVTPYDKELLNSYIANFNTEENHEKIKNILKTLYSIDKTPANYLNYIRHLLQYTPEEARVELSDKTPTAELAEVATQVTWLFADNNEYRKAYEWSAFSNDIDFVTKMNWLINLGDKKELETEYLKYIADHPDDYKAKTLMSVVYHEMGRFKDSWVLADSLPEGADKEDLRKMLNKDVVYEEEVLQQDLVDNHPKLFYPDVLKKLVKDYRLKRGDFVNLLSSLETNKANTAIQKNELSYSRFDKKARLHTLTATYNKYYKQEGVKFYDNNFNNKVMGLQYKFMTAEREGKPQYWSRARVELDQKSKAFYQFGLGLTSTKDKMYRAAEFNLYPVETAAGLNQGIYQAHLNLYQDFYLFKYINTSISIEGDYYTDGLLTRDTITNPVNFNPERPANSEARKIYTPVDANSYTVTDFGNSFGASATLRLMLDDGTPKKSRFIPFLEGQYAYGSRDLAIGYPYWMIKSRLYEGAGLGWKFKTDNFETRLEGGYFLDDYSSSFGRYTGNITYQLFDFTALTIGAELFSVKKYYSNSVHFGIQYNLKKRKKK